MIIKKIIFKESTSNSFPAHINLLTLNPYQILFLTMNKKEKEGLIKILMYFF